MNLSRTVMALAVLSIMAPTECDGLFAGLFASLFGKNDPPMTREEAVEYWASLDDVMVEQMTGTSVEEGRFWRGGEFPTGHRLDYLLTRSGWAGKIFISEEVVHPLVFYKYGSNDDVSYLDAKKVPRWLFVLNIPVLPRILAWFVIPFIDTEEAGAGVKLRSFLGQGPTAAMAYKETPAIDYFKWIVNTDDEKKVLGMMDDPREDDGLWFFTLTLDEDGP